MFRQGGRVVKSTIIKRVAFVVAIIVAFAPSAVLAQETGRIAILDVAKVFKENTSFDNKVKAIKAEADKFKAHLIAQQDLLKKEVIKVRDMPAGPQRNQMEADIEQQHAKLRTTARQTEAELLSREAQVYYETYQEMQAIVESLAKEHGLSLVMRFDSSSIDPNNREEVIRGVNRGVVFHRRLDLTSLVSQALNTRTAAAPTNLK